MQLLKYALFYHISPRSQAVTKNLNNKIVDFKQCLNENLEILVRALN